MNEKRQDIINSEPPIHALAEIISAERLGTYLNAAGHDASRALELYLWNAKIGEAFHIPIQAVEVGLRNRISNGLCTVFGPDWWQSEGFEKISDRRRLDDLDTVQRRLRNRGKDVRTGQIVAGLSFGFWVSMLAPRYNPTIWSAHFRSTFPKAPNNLTRDKMFKKSQRIANFRNRISHHEPIFTRDLSGDYSSCMEMLSWLCPEKRKWIKPHCRVPIVLRQKP